MEAIPIGQYYRYSISQAIDATNRIGEDFIMFDSQPDMAFVSHPYKMNTLGISLIIKGNTKGRINLNKHQINAPSLLFTLPEQILQMEEHSEDYLALHIVYSQQFAENISKYHKEYFSLYMNIYNNPIHQLDDRELDLFTEFYSKVKQILSDLKNPYRTEMVLHQLVLFFYMISYRYLQVEQKIHKTKQETLVDNFLTLVAQNYKKYRLLDFYADGLCITPKYLTTLVKKVSGTYASEWIEKYVILEAQALLKSTNLTIQQISDVLNFQSQAFFGKYFKRLVGVSPSEYRKK